MNNSFFNSEQREFFFNLLNNFTCVGQDSLRIAGLYQWVQGGCPELPDHDSYRLISAVLDNSSVKGTIGAKMLIEVSDLCTDKIKELTEKQSQTNESIETLTPSE